MRSPIVDPFSIAGDVERMTYLKDYADRRISSPYGKQERKGFTASEAREYIDGAMPDSGLVPGGVGCAGAWAALAAGVDAAGRLAMELQRGAGDIFDEQRIDKICSLVEESDSIDFDEKAFRDGSFQEMFAVSRTIEREAGGMSALMAGEDFWQLVDKEMCYVTGAMPRSRGTLAMREMAVEDSMASGFHSQLFERMTAEKWTIEMYSIARDAAQLMEQERFLNHVDDYRGRMTGIDTSVSPEKSAYMCAVYHAPGLPPSEESKKKIYDRQARLEDKVFSAIHKQMKLGFEPSDEFKEAIGMDVFDEWRGYQKDASVNRRVPETSHLTAASYGLTMDF